MAYKAVEEGGATRSGVEGRHGWKETLGADQVPGHDNLEPGGGAVERFGALVVVQAPVADGTAGHAQGQAGNVGAARAEAELRRLVGELVVGWQGDARRKTRRTEKNKQLRPSAAATHSPRKELKAHLHCRFARSKVYHSPLFSPDDGRATPLHVPGSE